MCGLKNVQDIKFGGTRQIIILEKKGKERSQRGRVFPKGVDDGGKMTFREKKRDKIAK